MDSTLDKVNLDINTMLINWGLMTGRYEDGAIKTAKFGQINMAFALIVFIFEAIKWSILIFFHEDSDVAIYLGEFAQYFGPKVVTDFIAIAEPVNSIIIILLYYFTSNKMHFWLDHMKFNAETRSFDKLDLNASDSKRFTKRFALLWFIIKCVNNFSVVFTFCTMFGSFLVFKNQYHIYYFVSILIFSIGVWYLANQWFALPLILYQVN